MTRRRRRAAVLLTTLVAAAPAASCSSTGPNASPGDLTELNLSAVEAPWLGAYQDIIAEYEAETGIEVNLTSFPFDGLMTQQANAAQIGSNAFDLFLINEQWVGLFYDNQWVQPLTDVDPDFSWDPDLIEFDGVGRWDTGTRTTALDGDPYALPINGNIHEFMYRADVYQQLGLRVPTDWDEVVANAERAVADGAVDEGYVARGKTPTYDFSAVLFSYGGSWFTDEAGGDWTPAIDTDEFRAALEQFKALADVGPPAPQTIAQAEAISLMQGGTVLQSALVTANAAPLEDPNASHVAGRIGYAVLPGRTPVSGTWVLGVPTGLPEERTQLAYDFLTWLTSKDTMQAWADNGGVTTRSDVVSDRPDLRVIIESADDVRGGLRYPFTPAMLDITDPVISQYLAGSMSLDDAVHEMQDALTEVVTDAGFLE
ncbi:ABC transporter substrate-binding protein [Jiangella asiatica]|uniref:Extracellular solute-binding protein n=1 Tax=Jiangella asiatica TaxID=2530372 RepID=A0A4R5DH88_9ACTN|nr:extracellular solute-binding protein [Jiangella asiatica]TDE11224.1 extracellular solute-binding protein [Jiangella asiatica]